MLNKKLDNRLKRIGGQLESLRLKIANDGDCQQTINQFLAVKGALNAALNEYLTSTISKCTSKDRSELAQLIKALVKN
ncbi:MAG TPA: metal-sensitive transcriptional regulator [Candidatus Paceibacterota bacterium]|nr:metal-sensitive transcriptional regulator [Candidatus Paceibacterota bacterium]HMO82963.1 metal-sensitive transcriptional regulator [Candidatus Paceibacterota bacterium]